MRVRADESGARIGRVMRFMFRQIAPTMLVLASLTNLLAACTQGAREMPGSRANAVLAQLLQAEIDAEIGRMNPTWSPGLIPQAPDNARAWLGEIDDVVARCRYGPRNHSKHNLMEYDVTLRGGERVTDVFSGQRCLYGVAPPLVMRVRFAQGRVGEVLTDGRELQAPVEAAVPELRKLAESVVRVDWARRPALYFPPEKSAADIARDWERGRR